MTNILLISDFFYEEIQGGAELNDKNLIFELENKYNVSQIKTAHFNQLFNIYQNVDLFVLSNFYFISKEAEEFLYKKKYIIIEHDYKFLSSRNPYLYPNFIIPKNEIIHDCLYKKAKKIIVQSLFQESIFKKNIDIENVYCLSGNLWKDEELELMKKMIDIKKNEKAAILKSNSEIKGTQEAINYCLSINKNYELISENNYKIFLELLGRYEMFVFFPKSPETFSRICLEAKMMGLKVITNDLVGVCKEEFFNYTPLDIIEKMKNKPKELISIIGNL